MLDWRAFFRRHNIEYVTTGPNASKGRINIRCPFCGQADPSEHMGVSIRGQGWSCWRNAAHRGTSSARLVQALLHCSSDEAQRLIADDKPALPSDEDLAHDLRQKLGVELEDATPPRKSILMPKEFKPLDNGSPLAQPFREYLHDERSYRYGQIDWLTEAYDLRYAIRGKFSYRIIIPVYSRYGDLLTWTARTIIKGEEQRYSSLSKYNQVCAPKESLLGLPLLWRCESPRALLVVEGPLDAMWITTFGRSFGVYATCLFGLSLLPQQMVLLEELRQRFPYMGLLLDAEASMQAFRLAHSGLDIDKLTLSGEHKDPAVMPPQAVIDLCLSIIG